jgi:hypothetical protein
MKWWGWVLIASFVVADIVLYACCYAAGKADEEIGIK